MKNTRIGPLPCPKIDRAHISRTQSPRRGWPSPVHSLGTDTRQQPMRAALCRVRKEAFALAGRSESGAWHLHCKARVCAPGIAANNRRMLRAICFFTATFVVPGQAQWWHFRSHCRGRCRQCQIGNSMTIVVGNLTNGLQHIGVPWLTADHQQCCNFVGPSVAARAEPLRSKRLNMTSGL